MAHRRLKKIVPVILSATSIMLVGCNSGTTSANQNNSANIAANSTDSITTQAATLGSTNIVTGSSVPTNSSCVKAVFQQVQVSNKLTTSLIVDNSCEYDVPLGGNKISFSSEYIDDTSAPIDALKYNYVNESNKTISYNLKLKTSRYLCPNGNGTAEMLTGTLGAHKVNAGTRVVMTNTTTLANGKIYDTQLAKSTFRLLPASDSAKNELGVSLTDTESFNYALQESNLNKGRDSLSQIPLNQFGLKTILVTNNTCNNMESAVPPLVLPAHITVDKIRSTCKIDGTQRLNSEQSCRYILRYDPSINDPIQQYESIVSVDVYAKDVSGNNITHSNTFNVPYSRRGSIMGAATTVESQLTVTDQNPGNLNITIKYFGLKKYTIRNTSNQVMESVSFSYAPYSDGIPDSLTYDMTQNRTTCKVNGKQTLQPGASCDVTLRYLPQIQQVNESVVFQALATNVERTVKYASNKARFNYTTNYNYTPSILNYTAVADMTGFNIDDNLTESSYRNSLTDIKLGTFGLKKFLITNDTGQNMYNVNLYNLSAFTAIPTLSIDIVRSTCKFNPTNTTFNYFSLKDGQSCMLVLKYYPTASKQTITYPLAISGYNVSGKRIVSDEMTVIGVAR